MKLTKEKYIIIEIIPTSFTPETGDIIQLSALKLEGLTLLERFDYRLEEKNIYIKDFIDMISYDKESFTYKKTSNEILEEFQKWSENLPILILNNQYTRNYLKTCSNSLEEIEPYFKMEYSDDFIEKLIEKNHIEPTNYIVDILYESLIKTI